MGLFDSQNSLHHIHTTKWNVCISSFNVCDYSRSTKIFGFHVFLVLSKLKIIYETDWNNTNVFFSIPVFTYPYQEPKIPYTFQSPTTFMADIFKDILLLCMYWYMCVCVYICIAWMFYMLMEKLYKRKRERYRGVGQKERLWIFNENCNGNKCVCMRL